MFDHNFDYFTKILSFDPICYFWPKLTFLTEIDIFEQNCHFWPKSPCLTKIAIFDPQTYCWAKFRLLDKLSIFAQLIYTNWTILGKDGTRKYNGLVDVYKKTLASDGLSGLYRGFVISCVGIFIYRGLYFGLYDTLKPMLLGDNAAFLASFLLGWSTYILTYIT